jgi:hypothetical protein
MRILAALFSVIFIMGGLMVFIAFAGSHGNLRFRPNQVQDWFMFGSAVVGLVGLLLITIIGIRNRNK